MSKASTTYTIKNDTFSLTPTRRFSMKCSDGLYRDPNKLESYFTGDNQGAFITAAKHALADGFAAILKEMNSK